MLRLRVAWMEGLAEERVLMVVMMGMGELEKKGEVWEWMAVGVLLPLRGYA